MVEQTPPAPHGFDAPQVISNYRLGDLLGSGGMGAVYEATDTRNGARVAIKLLHPHLAADESFRDRFNREAHVAALLRSPYTVPLLDSGFDQGRYFLVTRFVEGETLRESLRGGPLEPARALRIAAQVARSLEEAELRGIVHRDIKPDNVMLSEPDGTAQVLDFGIARQVGSQTLTAAGAFIGTPLYSAPEAAEGRADHRSDIYSLGVTLYHLLAGRPPFEGEPLETLRHHRETSVPLEALAGLPPEIAEVVARCMAKSPADRHQSASELAGVLEHLAEQSAGRGDRAATQAVTEAMEPGAPEPADTGAMTIALGPATPRGSFLPGRRSRSYEIAFRNDGDETLELRLEATGSEETLAFSLPDRVAVAPHDSAAVTVQIQPRRRRWRGPPESHQFQVAASPWGGGPPLLVSGEFEDRAQRWVPYAGTALFSVGLVGVVLALMSVLGGGGTPSDQEDALAGLRGRVEGLSLSEYFSQLDALDDESSEKLEAAMEEFEAEATVALRRQRQDEAIEAARDFVQELTTQGRGFRDALTEIEPPAAAEAAHNEWIAALSEWLRIIEEITETGIDSLSDAMSILTDRRVVAAAERRDRACVALEEIAAANDIDVDLYCEVSPETRTQLPRPPGGGLARGAGVEEGASVVEPVLRVSLTTTSDYAEMEIKSAELVRAATLVDPAELPEGWAASERQLSLRQSVVAAQSGGKMELTVDLQLDPSAIENGLTLAVKKAPINSFNVRIFAIVGREERSLVDISIDGPRGDGVDRARMIDLSPELLREAFAEFAGATRRTGERAAQPGRPTEPGGRAGRGRPAEGEPASRESVSILLGPVNEADGLTQIDAEDGATAPDERGGGRCRSLVDAGFDPRYMYFQVDDGFINATSTAVDVTVDYFDEGEFSWWLEYDGVDLAFTDSDLVRQTDSGEWRTHSFGLPDARFANRQQGEFDFRIAAGSGRTSLCVHRVVVERSGPALRLRLTTTSDWTIVEIANVSLVGAISLVEPAELPEGWWVERDSLNVSQSVAEAKYEREIELSVDLRLRPAALTDGLRFRVRKGALGSSRVEFFSVTDGAERLILGASLDEARGDGVTTPRMITLPAELLQQAFPEFAPR